MLTGITLAAYPNTQQKILLSQWFGCFRFIWNAKCEEDHYLLCFARKYLPSRTYPQINQSFAQYKNKEISPWLFKVPSQLLRIGIILIDNLSKDFAASQNEKENPLMIVYI